MLKKLRSAIYGAPDLAIAKRFYRALLDKAPYFDEPFYVGFDLDGCELGLDPNAVVAAHAVAYWRVESLETAIQRAIDLGGRRDGEPRDVGGGIRMAVVVDPSGNHVGLIEESHG